MITLTEAKEHLRIEHSDEDTFIEALVDAATSAVENATGRAIKDRTVSLTLDGFDDPIKLPWWPIRSITSISYLDKEGASQTQATYTLDSRTMPAKLMPVYGQKWPDTTDAPMSVTITAQVGYQTIPEDLSRAILLIVGSLYEHREAVSPDTLTEIPLTMKYLLQSYVIPRLS